jgi:hypothetical protein
VERHSLRDGLRLNGATRAELVTPQPDEPPARDLPVRQTRQIDVLYRAWSRRRGDAEALRELHGAIGAGLDGFPSPPLPEVTLPVGSRGSSRRSRA